ncbi:MAG: hypothetical protein H6765_01305 [Candidatus Peribacteria bacterium]|nr:MAG: hypothetical protein H6765_01305 [Candidatus Peribacteria bacterium]
MTTNYLIFTVDLSYYTGDTNLELQFDYSHHGAENSTEDRVWIRGSSGASWLQIYDWYANRAAA